MAISKVLIASVFVSFLLLNLVDADEWVKTAPNNPYYVATNDCGAKCAFRCQKSWKNKLCMRTCGVCCERCNCVPPGTAGNEIVCPCYYKMTTHGGRHKCP